MELHADSRLWTTNYEVIQLTDTVSRYCCACSVCHKCLSGKDTISQGAARYCWQCYEKIFGLQCTSCFHSIKGLSKMSFIFYNGRVWHKTCFRCPVCKKSLEGEHIIEGKGSLFCKRCGEGQILVIG